MPSSFNFSFYCSYNPFNYNGQKSFFVQFQNNAKYLTGFTVSMLDVAAEASMNSRAVVTLKSLVINFAHKISDDARVTSKAIGVMNEFTNDLKKTLLRFSLRIGVSGRFCQISSRSGDKILGIIPRVC